MKENRSLTKEERYNINQEFRHMLSLYKKYLYPSMMFLINENIGLYTTDIGVLTLFVTKKNKKPVTIFNYFDYKFIK